jgi:phosphoribosylglycinamide formyltransferase-1
VAQTLRRSPTAFAPAAFPTQIAPSCNREGAPGIDRARARGLASRVIPSKGLEREAYDRQVVAALREASVELICLAGYMRLLSPYFIAAFPLRILNIHPSLLPSFPGLESQKQALEYGVKFAGCTVHFVDENLDAGPIVLQAIVPVDDHDTEGTLSARILKEEHRIYTEAVKIILAGNYKIEGRRVSLKNDAPISDPSKNSCLPQKRRTKSFA